MGKMKIHGTGFEGLAVIETAPVADARGQFTRLFCESECAVLRPGLHWTQINLSRTATKGTVRGLHFQRPPAAEIKLIRCVRGRVFDVAVDLRAGSPTFLRWHGIELSERNGLQFFVPEGFAHGFQTLTDEAEILYLDSAAWNPELERGLRYDDPRLAIGWPLPVTLVSEKDRNTPLLTDQFAGIQL